MKTSACKEIYFKSIFEFQFSNVKSLIYVFRMLNNVKNVEMLLSVET